MWVWVLHRSWQVPAAGSILNKGSLRGLPCAAGVTLKKSLGPPCDPAEVVTEGSLWWDMGRLVRHKGLHHPGALADKSIPEGQGNLPFSHDRIITTSLKILDCSALISDTCTQCINALWVKKLYLSWRKTEWLFANKNKSVLQKKENYYN